MGQIGAAERRSGRTIARHFRRQTGMSFAEWRSRARLRRELGAPPTSFRP